MRDSRSFREILASGRGFAAAAVALGLAAILLTVGVWLRPVMAQKTTFRRHIARIAMPLTIYFIDVEGGQSTLFVTPSKQSLLVDAGWPDHGRSAERIVAAAKEAGLDHIDYLLITHYHVDHVGGLPALAKRIPIGTFIDHGPNRQTSDAETERGYQRYQALLASSHAKRILARPGEKIHLGELTATIVSADGKLIDSPLPGAGQPNPYCKTSPKHPADQTENARSVGMMMQFGKAWLIDLGDLTWDKEMQLMCPVNKLGQVDLYVVSHHGWDHSGSPAFVDGIAPLVAVMDNGENKGGSPSTWDIIEKSPRLKNLWQLHYSAEGGAQHNVAPGYIANLKGGSDGNYIRVSLFPDGRMVVYNSRTRASKSYPVH